MTDRKTGRRVRVYALPDVIPTELCQYSSTGPYAEGEELAGNEHATVLRAAGVDGARVLVLNNRFVKCVAFEPDDGGKE
jgi:hypothetical protein